MDIPEDIDLTEGRWMDKLFTHWIERDGIDYAVRTWRRLHAEEMISCNNQRLVTQMARERFYTRATYKKLGETYGYTASVVSKRIKHMEERIRQDYTHNKNKVEEMVTTVPEELAYVLDPRVILQENCALLMGKDEIKDTLIQLTMLGELDEKR